MDKRTVQVATYIYPWGFVEEIKNKLTKKLYNYSLHMGVSTYNYLLKMVAPSMEKQDTIE